MLLTQTAVSDSFWVTFVKSFGGNDLNFAENWSQQLFMFTVHFFNTGCVEEPQISALIFVTLISKIRLMHVGSGQKVKL